MMELLPIFLPKEQCNPFKSVKQCCMDLTFFSILFRNSSRCCRCWARCQRLLVPAVLLEAPDVVNAQDCSSDVGIDKPWTFEAPEVFSAKWSSKCMPCTLW
jgi:hypothetical protein